ncbi:hypothetical protein [Pseudolactococcus insecticola]|uniref:Uncharacterized protein n=1 Tax=Pseudolactococcus insecticola TaxID=2709158 RepID=A0A6A0B8X8_9LACT|nr:hypothetical protein [Lactococcus insecticola]GFH40297.1 hypothetical protein Hs20B_06950 [Lactococcus insecticola]
MKNIFLNKYLIATELFLTAIIAVGGVIVNENSKNSAVERGNKIVATKNIIKSSSEWAAVREAAAAARTMPSQKLPDIPVAGTDSQKVSTTAKAPDNQPSAPKPAVGESDGRGTSVETEVGSTKSSESTTSHKPATDKHSSEKASTVGVTTTARQTAYDTETPQSQTSSVTTTTASNPNVKKASDSPETSVQTSASEPIVPKSPRESQLTPSTTATAQVQRVQPSVSSESKTALAPSESTPEVKPEPTHTSEVSIETPQTVSKPDNTDTKSRDWSYPWQWW